MKRARLLLSNLEEYRKSHIVNMILTVYRTTNLEFEFGYQKIKSCTSFGPSFIFSAGVLIQEFGVSLCRDRHTYTVYRREIEGVTNI